MESESRGRLFYFFIALVLFFFFLKLVELQIFRHGEYGRFADENASRVSRIRAPRGIIYDRFDRVLVRNRPVFSLLFFPDELLEEDRQRVLWDLSRKTGISYQELFAKVSSSKALSYEGVKLISDLPPRSVTKIKESAETLPGVKIVVYPLRDYPHKSSGVQMLGSIGEINRRELDALGPGYRSGDLIGKDGLEKVYDSYLRGVEGGEKLEVDAFGQPIRMIETLEPIAGNNIALTIDSELQDAVDDFMKGKNGAVVVLDPKNGEILSMVSHPAYDPMQEWEKINQRSHPFMNRALSAYPPGSIFKSIVLQAALAENKFRAGETITCHGFRKMGNRIARCWKEGGHGTLTYVEGLVWSCDVAFYELALRLGPDTIASFARKFGLGTKTGIDLPNEKAGLVPDKTWKKEKLKQIWFEGETINYGIGQGYLLVTPIQMASVYAEIATGKRFKPYLVKEIYDAEGKVIFQNSPEEVGAAGIFPEIRQALREVVDRATGRAAKVEGLPASGKTGTAENPGLPHAWFLCYAPSDDPEIVISVFVEHGEHGDRSAAQVAGQILQWYKKNRL